MGWPIKGQDQDDETTRLGVRTGQGGGTLGLRFPCSSGSGRDHDSVFFAMALSAGLVIVVIRALFPAGRLFPIAFASLIAVYAAIFSLFVEEIFRGIDAAFLVGGF